MLSLILLSSTLLGWLNAPANAYWVLGCGKPVAVERLDPIMDPGTVSGHVHTVMGGDAFNATMSYETTQESSCTTCTVTKDLSNYWVPTLYYRSLNGTFTSVNQTGGLNAYYEQRIDPNDPEFSSGIHAFPAGFRMMAGDPSLRNYSDTLAQRAISFACLSTDGPGNQTNGLPDEQCGNGLRAQVSFPMCWDGVNPDSLDHRSHVAYPSLMDNGICPDSHPKRLMYLFLETMWDVSAFDDMWYGGDQPFVFSFGDPTGYGFHGDFLNGWDVDLLQAAIDDPTCGDSTGGDITKCGTLLPSLQDADAQDACSPPRDVVTGEQVTGTLSALPGYNPVQNGPGMATLASCAGAAPTARIS